MSSDTSFGDRLCRPTSAQLRRVSPQSFGELEESAIVNIINPHQRSMVTVDPNWTPPPGAPPPPAAPPQVSVVRPSPEEVREKHEKAHQAEVSRSRGTTRRTLVVHEERRADGGALIRFGRTRRAPAALQSVEIGNKTQAAAPCKRGRPLGSSPNNLDSRAVARAAELWDEAGGIGVTKIQVCSQAVAELFPADKATVTASDRIVGKLTKRLREREPG